ncbi:MAG: aminopeptidase N [Bordetella sp.]|nr:MAG: aminopeptidase N [Bordetella sp.]
MKTSLDTIYRKDYKAYPYKIENVNLTFDLSPEITRVCNIMDICCKLDSFDNILHLNGEDLELISLSVNGKLLNNNQYTLTSKTLSIHNFPKKATMKIVSQCKPNINSVLMGLYISKGNFITQCEPEGFRRITWFADRPDVLSRYRVTIRASKDFPILLSNGNLIKKEILSDGRQEVQWYDPFPKPCYLFALVAGNYIVNETYLNNYKNRNILLQIYSSPDSTNKTQWALDSLIQAIQWDEKYYGLELDLERFMIVSVHDFNMGAMENKGLNIFNSAYVLANSETATDSDYENIQSVIGHEYFHNWTGNRITCRDWFQLSLKEGLTVFRDQQFSAAIAASDFEGSFANSVYAVKRIDNVINLRAEQFAEDESPLAHPIRPESYSEISNFYTETIYEKGAEVIRMLHTLLGNVRFLEGMKEYFRKYDGKAATCDDFLNIMEFFYIKYNPGKNLSAFHQWYLQAGTPKVKVTIDHCKIKKSCVITLEQSCKPVGIEQNKINNKKPYHIPFSIGFLDHQGNSIPLILKGSPPSETVLLELSKPIQRWVFEDISDKPIPSLLRNFSAPITVDYSYTESELYLLCLHDKDLFSRWESVNKLASHKILNLAKQITQNPILVNNKFIKIWEQLLTDSTLDPSYRARILSLPEEKTLSKYMKPIDTPSLLKAIEILESIIGNKLSNLWERIFNNINNYKNDNVTYSYISAGYRALKNLALYYLVASDNSNGKILAQKQYEKSDNMTDRIAALSLLINFYNEDLAIDALERFYEKWNHDPLVIDKWFSLQARGRNTDVKKIRKLMNHPKFDWHNPNRVRSVIFQFCMHNTYGIHQSDGSGYEYWIEQVLILDKINPEIASRLARAFDNWSYFTDKFRYPMKKSLEYLYNYPNLSKNVSEVIFKTLEFSYEGEVEF